MIPEFLIIPWLLLFIFLFSLAIFLLFDPKTKKNISTRRSALIFFLLPLSFSGQLALYTLGAGFVPGFGIFLLGVSVLIPLIFFIHAILVFNMLKKRKKAVSRWDVLKAVGSSFFFLLLIPAIFFLFGWLLDKLPVLWFLQKSRLAEILILFLILSLGAFIQTMLLKLLFPKK